MKELLILGNARSLHGFPFYNYQIDTMGINIAYRFWHQINWYPTYYISLDHKVNQFYGSDIYDLIINRYKYGIKGFLLRNIFLKKYPDVKNIKEVAFLENINRDSNKGFTGDKQVTSGSFSVRWGIYLGYQKIYLLGIDCCYLPVKDLKLNNNGILLSTPIPNPNYFYDGYQSKGDRLHLSNKKPKQDGRKLNHLETFRKIHREFNQIQVRPKSLKKSENVRSKDYNKTVLGKLIDRNHPIVVNSNLESKLTTLKILPYEPLPSILLKKTDLLEISFDQISKQIIPKLEQPITTVSQQTVPPNVPKLIATKNKSLSTSKNISKTKVNKSIMNKSIMNKSIMNKSIMNKPVTKVNKSKTKVNIKKKNSKSQNYNKKMAKMAKMSKSKKSKLDVSKTKK